MRHSSAKYLVFLCFAVCLARPAFLTATNVVVFSNFETALGYNTSDGNVVGLGGFAEADSFSPSSTASFESLQLALTCAFACPNPFTVSLALDDHGSPGAVIESFTYAGTLLEPFGTKAEPVLLNSILNPTLLMRTPYWIQVQGDRTNSDAIAWNWNTTGDPSSEAISYDGGSNWFAPSGQTPGAYQINATVPEPSTCALLLGAFLLFVVRRCGKGQLTGCIVLIVFLSNPAHGLAASWDRLNNFAPGGAGVMIQLTDGTVMIQNGSSQNWMRLTPDAKGSYINGTWSANPIAPMNLDRLYFAAQVLQDGRVWVLGGEYSGPYLDSNITPEAEIWNPVSNSWSPAASYPPELGPFGCGTITVSSAVNESATDVLTGIYSTSRLQVGWTVSGTGIPSGTTVTSIDSPSQVHISNPATSTQIVVARFTGRTLACFGDDPSILLPNGDIFAGNIFTNTVATYSVATDAWTSSVSKYYSDRSDEEGWAKLSNDKILVYDLFQSISASNGNGYAELFDPYTHTWNGISPVDNTAHGSLQVLSSAALGDELGPTIRLQDGRILQVGANQRTALYTETTNTWTPGPEIVGSLTNSQGTVPAFFGADDAPAAALPNGHIILAADASAAAFNTTGDLTSGSSVITNISSTAGVQPGWRITAVNNGLTVLSGSVTGVDSAHQIRISTVSSATLTGVRLSLGAVFSSPTQLFDFDPAANTISPVSPPIPDASLNSRPSYVTRMLVLPTGQLLFSDSSQILYVYTPDGATEPAMRPVVTQVVYRGRGVFSLEGKQLNGQSAGASYGDDVQNDENYPLVRLTNASGLVFYCRTTNWSSTSVGPSPVPETVDFTLNPAVTAGNYTLVVSGAGISSAPTFINIAQTEVNGQ